MCLNYSESPMLLAGTTTWQRRKNHLLIKTVPKFTYVFQFVNNIYHSLSSLYEPVESVRPRIRTLFINIYHLQHLHPDNVSGRTLIHKFKINWGSNSRVPNTVQVFLALTCSFYCRTYCSLAKTVVIFCGPCGTLKTFGVRKKNRR